MIGSHEYAETSSLLSNYQSSYAQIKAVNKIYPGRVDEPSVNRHRPVGNTFHSLQNVRLRSDSPTYATPHFHLADDYIAKEDFVVSRTLEKPLEPFSILTPEKGVTSKTVRFRPRNQKISTRNLNTFKKETDRESLNKTELSEINKQLRKNMIANQLEIWGCRNESKR